MSRTFQSDDWNTYRMDYRNPHREIEAPEKEIATVDAALDVLRERQQAIAELEKSGVVVVDSEAGALSPAVVNRYLEIKTRVML